MIADHLPRYYEAHGNDMRYHSLRSIVIDGHEVAWMKYTGTVQYDILGKGREGESFEGHDLCCECDFAEGVGWKLGTTTRKGHEGEEQMFSLDGPRRCLAKQAAQHLRHLELRREYEQSFDDPMGGLFAHIPEIIEDLAKRTEAGEFIGETGSGARFYGGYFYLQTVAAIADVNIGRMWDVAYRMVAEKKIGLDGAVVLPYREPPPPRWNEHMRAVDDDGWTMVGSLPGHRDMPREWRLEVFKPDGEPAYSFVPPLGLGHDPVFGPDVEDVERARSKLESLCERAKAEDDADAVH